MDLRNEIDHLISAGSAKSASLRLAELWRKEAGTGTAAFLVSRYEKLSRDRPLVPFRLAILRSFTVEPAIAWLRAEAFVNGIDLTVHLGDFNAYAQEILDPDSSLHRFAADATILAVRTPEIAPDLWRDFSDLSPESVAGVVQRVCDGFSQWIQAFRTHTAGALILHSVELPARLTMGILDTQSRHGQAAAIHQINQKLRELAEQYRGVYTLDYDGLVARHGRLHWHDERKWLVARMPIAGDHLVYLAREWLRFLVPLSGKISKVLVADLDNTLWGGIIGEDGITGIKLGAEYPGAAYQSLQRTMLDLARRGIVLAICSKNNPEEAMQVLESHPGMLLRPRDFSAMRINWSDKPQNLREIAAELNVGIDTLAFIDDNPGERELVRSTLPEVMVIDLPQDPMGYAAAVRDCPAFERLGLSSEDLQRTALYAAQRQRSQTEQNFQTKEDFFRYLEQEAEINPVSQATLARVAQLTQKTNQFNLTTRRHTEQQIAEMAARPGWQVLSLNVRDRFGEHGLVGVAVTRDEGETCAIETFLLSCRVIGRTVETALLSHLAHAAAARGQRHLTGRFIPTKKNAPSRDFYQQHGFKLLEQDHEGSVWTLDLQHHTITTPDWIRLKTSEGEHH